MTTRTGLNNSQFDTLLPELPTLSNRLTKAHEVRNALMLKKYALATHFIK